MKRWRRLTFLVLATFAAPAAADQQDAPLQVAKRLTNPFADMISVPVNQNPDFGLDAQDDWRYTLTLQPVVPIHLNREWNIISRTVAPAIYDDSDGAFGLGDIAQSIFLSPTGATDKGWIWGAGSIVLLPTATVDRFGADRWGLGPTVGLLRRRGPWTVGALMNHTWSLHAAEDHDQVSATFLQPFVDYTMNSRITVSLNTESTYSWTGEQWTVPVNFVARRLFNFNGQRVSLGLGARYYFDGPDGGAEWGLRLGVTFLFAK